MLNWLKWGRLVVEINMYETIKEVWSCMYFLNYGRIDTRKLGEKF
jgi:hypothetical protein